MSSGHGDDAEDILEKTCHEIFGQDLTGRSPVLHKPSGDIELADNLIWFDRCAVVFQSKSIDMLASELDDVKAGRVVKKIEKAKQQLRRTANARRKNIPTTFINGVDIRSPIDWRRINRLVGIITINIQDLDYEDPEQRLSMPLAVDDDGDMEIHLFILRDLFHLVPEMSTPVDALHYLQDRAWAARNGFRCGNELDFMGFLKSQYPQFEAIRSGENPLAMAVITPGYWEDFQSNEHANQARATNFRDSQLYDHILDENRTSIGHMVETGQLEEVEATQGYFEVQWLLASLRRIERREVSRKMLEKYGNTAGDRPFSYFLSLYPDRDFSILVFVSNEKDRQQRIAELSAYGCMACHRVKTKRLLAIGIQGQKLRGESFDFVIMDVGIMKATEPLDDPERWFPTMTHSKVEEWE